MHPVVFVVIPNPLHKGRIEPFRAALCHVGTRLPVIAEHPLAHPPQARPAVKIQINNGVAFRQPHFHGAAVISVDDPSVHVHRHGQPGVKFLPGHISPALFPPQLVKMHHRQSQLFSQSHGKGGFSAAGAANNQNFLHIPPYYVNLQPQKQVCLSADLHFRLLLLSTQRPSRSCAWRAFRSRRRCRPDAPASAAYTGRTCRRPLSSSARRLRRRTTWS